MTSLAQIAEQFHRSSYPHISEVFRALELVGVTDDVKKLCAICNAPSLFYSMLCAGDKHLTTHNKTIIAEYIEYKYKFYHMHPCLRHIQNVLAKNYGGHDFTTEEFIKGFLDAFDVFYKKFESLCLEETGMKWTCNGYHMYHKEMDEHHRDNG